MSYASSGQTARLDGHNKEGLLSVFSSVLEKCSQLCLLLLVLGAACAISRHRVAECGIHFYCLNGGDITHLLR